MYLKSDLEKSLEVQNCLSKIPCKIKEKPHWDKKKIPANLGLPAARLLGFFLAAFYITLQFFFVSLCFPFFSPLNILSNHKNRIEYTP